MGIIQPKEVRSVLSQWLGCLLLDSSTLAQEVSQLVQQDRQKRYDLLQIKADLQRLLLTRVNGLTAGNMCVILENYRTQKLTLDTFHQMTDALMELVFSELIPFSENFNRINEYSMREESLAALKVLYLKYKGYFQEEEYRLLIAMIQSTYPREAYCHWLEA